MEQLTAARTARFAILGSARSTAQRCPGEIGNNEHRLLSVLAQRAAAGSLPGARQAGQRVALAIEGGGMRGTISAGMALVLSELGLLPLFDAVYGSSARSPGRGCSAAVRRGCTAGPTRPSRGR